MAKGLKFLNYTGGAYTADGGCSLLKSKTHLFGESIDIFVYQAKNP